MSRLDNDTVKAGLFSLVKVLLVVTSVHPSYSEDGTIICGRPIWQQSKIDCTLSALGLVQFCELQCFSMGPQLKQYFSLISAGHQFFSSVIWLGLLAPALHLCDRRLQYFPQLLLLMTDTLTIVTLDRTHGALRHKFVCGRIVIVLKTWFHTWWHGQQSQS